MAKGGGEEKEREPSNHKTQGQMLLRVQLSKFQQHRKPVLVAPRRYFEQLCLPKQRFLEEQMRKVKITVKSSPRKFNTAELLFLNSNPGDFRQP